MFGTVAGLLSLLLLSVADASTLLGAENFNPTQQEAIATDLISLAKSLPREAPKFLLSSYTYQRDLGLLSVPTGSLALLCILFLFPALLWCTIYSPAKRRFGRGVEKGCAGGLTCCAVTLFIFAIVASFIEGSCHVSLFRATNAFRETTATAASGVPRLQATLGRITPLIINEICNKTELGQIRQMGEKPNPYITDADFGTLKTAVNSANLETAGEMTEVEYLEYVRVGMSSVTQCLALLVAVTGVCMTVMFYGTQEFSARLMSWQLALSMLLVVFATISIGLNAAIGISSSDLCSDTLSILRQEYTVNATTAGVSELLPCLNERDSDSSAAVLECSSAVEIALMDRNLTLGIVKKGDTVHAIQSDLTATIASLAPLTYCSMQHTALVKSLADVCVSVPLSAIVLYALQCLYVLVGLGHAVALVMLKRSQLAPHLLDGDLAVGVKFGDVYDVANQTFEARRHGVRGADRIPLLPHKSNRQRGAKKNYSLFGQQ